MALQGCETQLNSSDPNLLNAAVTTTPTIAACTDNALNSSQCTSAADRYIASTVGKNANGSGTNTGATTTVMQVIPAAFYDGTTSTATI